MSTYISDQETIAALDKLITLIHEGLSQAWDGQVIEEAKQQIAVSRKQFEKSIGQTQQQIEAINLKIELVKKNYERLSSELDVVNRLQNTLEQWGGIDKLREDLSKLEVAEDLVHQIREGQQTIQSFQRDSEELKTTVFQLNHQLDELGGPEVLIQQFDQVRQISAILDELEQRVTDNITPHISRFLSEFQSEKAQIERWQSEVLSETNQKLDTLSQIYDSALFTINSRIEQTEQDITNHTNTFWAKLVTEREKDELSRTEALNRGRQNLDDIQKLFSETQQLANKIELVKKNYERFSSELDVVNRLQNTLEQWGGIDKLREDLLKLEVAEDLVHQIREGQQTIQSFQGDSEELKTTVSQLNHQLNELGGSEILIQQFNQVRQISAILDELEQRVTDSITPHMNRFLSEFQSEKDQIERWQSEVLSETNQKLDTLLQIRESALSTINSRIEQTEQDITNHTNTFWAKLVAEREKDELSRTEALNRGRQNFDDMQRLFNETQQSANKNQNNLSEITTRLEVLQKSEGRLEAVMIAMENLSTQLGGKDSFETFTTQLQELEALIQAEKLEFQNIRNNIYAEFQQLLSYDIEGARGQFRAEFSSLRNELNYQLRTELNSFREEWVDRVNAYNTQQNSIKNWLRRLVDLVISLRSNRR